MEDELTELLRSGGVDLSKFDQRGAKDLKTLRKEVEELDVRVLRHWDGRILRAAHSVKVMIYGGRKPHRTTAVLRETHRKLPDGTKIQRMRPWGLSETRKRYPQHYDGDTLVLERYEDLVDAALRGLREELHIRASADELRRLPQREVLKIRKAFGMRITEEGPEDPLKMVDCDFNLEPSSVYPGIWSATWSYWYVYRLPSQFYNGRGHVATEPSGTRVYARWFSIPKGEKESVGL